MQHFRHHAFAHALLLAAIVFPAAAGAASPLEVHGLKIDGVWARATPPGAKVGGGFLHIVNTAKSADRLIGATAPDVAAKVEIHQSIMTGNVARMRQVVGGLAIPPAGSLTLKPGGYHLMFLGLKAPLKKGEHIKATLDFKTAGKVDVIFDVRGIGAGASQGMHMN
jgi:hypothetical protein